MAGFPHCDPRILHAPGECEYCDRHPDRQELRRSWGIAFTGHAPTTAGWTRELPCPADHNRPAGGANDHRRWGGNRATADTRGALAALKSIDEYSKALPATAGLPVMTSPSLPAHTFVVATPANIAAAFTEWDRRYREDPAGFANEAARLLTSDAETYGDEAAPYFIAILKDVEP